MAETASGHDHHAHGTHAAQATGRRLAIALAITITFFVVEVIGAVLTNSLALLADAGHMLTDVAALSLAFVAAWLARRPHSALRSYGTMRAEILAALANGTGLLIIAGYIFIEAAGRLREPPQVDGGPMLAVAALGLAANLVSARVLMSGPRHDLNLRGALFHVASDAAGSVGALTAAALMLAYGWYLADSIAGMIVSVLLVVTSFRLIWPATHILLEGTPHGLDLRELERTIMAQPGVLQVHDLHAWTLTSGYNAVTAHVLVAQEIPSREREEVLDNLRHMIPARFHVRHVTLQLEESAECCEETHMPGVVVHSRPAARAHSHQGHEEHR